VDADVEIAALIATLQATGERLEALTGGEVDSLADRSGRTLLLRGVQEQLRHADDVRQAAILNALPAHVALLDARGLILSVNDAWRRFGAANALEYAGHGVGINYLDVCDRARGNNADEARQVADGIRSVLAGSVQSFSLEYPCHASGEKRWFLMNVAPLAGDPPSGAVIMHLNVTAEKLSEERYRLLFDASIDAILLTAPDGRVFTANPSACRMFGWSEEELKCGGRAQVIDDSDPRLAPAMKERSRSGSFTGELGFVRKGGETFPGEVASSLFRDKDGNARSSMIIRDVGERRKNEQALARQQAELRALFDLMPAMVWFKDTHNGILRVNQRVADAAGMAVADIEGKPSADIYPQDAARFFEDDLKVIRSGVSLLGYVERLKSPNGEDRWVQTDKVPFFDGGGKVAGIVVVAQDISERKRGEHNLQRFRAAMDSSGDAIVLVDRASMRYVDVNQTLCNLVGYTRQEVVGMTPMDLFGAERSILERDYDAIIADPGSSAGAVEGHYRHKDGRLIPIETRRRALRTEDGWIIVGSARDITERLIAADRIHALNRVNAMLSGINALIVRVGSRDELFREACRIAVDAGGFRMAWIGVVDRAASSIVLTASAGADRDLLASIRDLFASAEGALEGNTLVAQAVRTRRVFSSNDSGHDPAVLLGAKFAAQGVRAMAILPLVVAEDAFGVLVLYAGKLDFFHDEELGLLSELAGNIAFAIENFAKEAERREAEAKVRRLSRVYAVLSGINSLIVRVHDRDELFEEACRVATNEGGFRMAWIGVLDPGSGRIAPIASAGATTEQFAGIKAFYAAERGMPEGTSLAAKAMASGKPSISSDLANNTGTPLGRKYADSGILSIAFLPLLVADQAVGVLGLYSDIAQFFDHDEMRLLTELAGDVAHAIEHLGRQDQLDYLAYYDALTGLANRTLFLERVTQHIRGAAGAGQKLALFLVDLERFRNINDSLGRPEGDVLLKQVAVWLTQNAGDASLVARIGADQFALVLPLLRPEGSIAHLIETSMAAFMLHPFHLEGALLRLSLKLGAAVFPEDGEHADTLLKNAEAALKRAKTGGERYLLYTQGMTDQAGRKLTLENQLRQALDNGEFVLHYQPKANLASGKLTSAEALIRWNDPRTGLVPPGRFIPILEETGLIYDVGRWALQQALQDYLRWRNAGLPAVRIAVNVSPLQLRNRGFFAEIERVLGVDTASAAGLELEITESLIMEDVKHSIASLTSIRALGVTVAIDDFGTGFSSLSYLAKLPVDTLKIDRSFVTDMTTSPEGLALVSTIINLGHSLKLNLVAEGVETEEQSRLLRLLKCDEMQGFLFGKPVSCEDFEARFLGRK
jgi:diguanylate cyclase (GGDEF)-like protein/PAS domain S-box-containing protein